MILCVISLWIFTVRLCEFIAFPVVPRSLFRLKQLLGLEKHNLDSVNKSVFTFGSTQDRNSNDPQKQTKTPICLKLQVARHGK